MHQFLWQDQDSVHNVKWQAILNSLYILPNTQKNKNIFMEQGGPSICSVLYDVEQPFLNNGSVENIANLYLVV